MPINLIKKYPELLEILHMVPAERQASLRRIFNRECMHLFRSAMEWNKRNRQEHE